MKSVDSVREHGAAHGTVRRRRVAVRASLLAVVTCFGVSGTAAAATINVTTSGPPVFGKCSLTQAIRAATTNQAVGSCPAGSQFSSDTIWLQANTTYADYGGVLHVPSTGGALTIRGALSSGRISSTISGRNYGYPASGPNFQVCQYPAALFSAGSNLTVRDLALVAKPQGDGHTGICQYSGSLTLTNVIIGDGAEINYFNRGAIWSFPNTTGNARTLTMTDVYVDGNYSVVTGGGVALFGSMTVNITRGRFYGNTSQESGGGLSWRGSGTLTITDTEFSYNTALYSSGGGMSLNPESSSATATLKGVNMQQNHADQNGGAIFVGNMVGANKIAITSGLNGSYIVDNSAGGGVGWDPAERTFNTDPNWAYDSVWCTGGSTFSGLHLAPWTSHNPRLRGDGSCSFYNW